MERLISNKINYINDNIIKESNKLIIKSIELMLIREISAIEPDCNEFNILSYAKNILRISHQGNNTQEYYYIKSKYEKVYLFKTYWKIDFDQITVEAKATFHIEK